MDEAARVVDGFAGQRVLVIGEAMLDRYLHGSADRLCREAPVPVVAIARRDDVPGGAANTAACVAALGADVAFLSVIGDDAEGEALRAALVARGVATGGVQVQPGRATLAKNRVVAAGQILVRFDSGDTADARAGGRSGPVCHPRRSLADGGRPDRFRLRLRRADAARARDPRAVGRAAIHSPCSWTRRTYPRTAICARRRSSQTTPRRAPCSASPAPSMDGDRATQIIAHADALFARTGTQIAAVTLDRAGALVLTRDASPMHVPATATAARR